MKRIVRRSVVLFACALAAGCGGRPGPGEMEGLLTPLTVEPPPIYGLIGARVDLDLSSAQVASLDSIARDVQARNRPLIVQLDSVTGNSGRGVRRVNEEGQPILDTIRANARRASESVHALLTEAQRVEVCTLFDVDEEGRGRSRPASRDTMQMRGRGLPAAWHWCDPTGAATAE